MNGLILKHLAGVSDLARLDIEAAGVTLEAKDNMLTAGYTGGYARGYRALPISEDLEFSVSVSALRFKTIVSMFTDEDKVFIDVTDAGLDIRTKGSKAVLNHWGEVNDFAELDKRNLEFSARLPTEDLIREIETAAEFVSESQTNPAITGIKIAFGKELEFMSYDGGGALYRSRVNARVKGHGELIVPTQDFLLGAKLIGTGDTILAKPRGSDAIALFSKEALFRSSLISAPFPDLSRVTRQQPSASFTVEAGMIRNLVACAKALDAGPDIEVRANKNGTDVLFGSESESGSFTVSAKGRLANALHYDAVTLGKVTRLGSVLSFAVPTKPTEATLVESDHRCCWIVTRI